MIIHDGSIRYIVAEIIAYRNMLVLRELDCPENVIKHALGDSFSSKAYPIGTVVTIVRSSVEYVVRREKMAA
jgi:hypothetical protein